MPAAKMIPRKDAYGPTDVARILRVSNSTIIRAIDSGILPGSRSVVVSYRSVTHDQLVGFIKSHPEFAFALDALGDEGWSF